MKAILFLLLLTTLLPAKEPVPTRIYIPYIAKHIDRARDRTLIVWVNAPKHPVPKPAKGLYRDPEPYGRKGMPVVYSPEVLAFANRYAGTGQKMVCTCRIRRDKDGKGEHLYLDRPLKISR